MLSRRQFLAGLAAPLLCPTSTRAEQGREPFPVHKSDINEVQYRFRRREVSFESTLPKGALFADIKRRYLFLVLGEGKAMRYGVGIGKLAQAWEGEATIKRKAKWPSWHPTPEMLALYGDDPNATWLNGISGGPKNPLGARALYLYQGNVDTLFRIHGTNQPGTIGTASSRGCLRMINVDIIDLYDRVAVGSKIIVSKSGKL
jgi:lipoprotein-anchoring transpeptidase ErfK/SrfK